MFNDAIEAFGSNIQGVRGSWRGGGELADNYNSFMAAVRSGLSPEAAAARTFTGKMSIRNGFTNIRVVSVTKEKIVVEFTR
jgi:hypothetical protein